MKTYTFFFILASLFVFTGQSIAQQKVAVHPGAESADSVPTGVGELKVGDFLPDLEFTNVLNSPEGKIKLSDYRGKLLILDFWATWCAPCVSSFPKLDSLNAAMGNELAVIPVTYQSGEEVEKLFSRASKLSEIKMPMVVGDNTLRLLFPHKTLPHYVWIDPQGLVIATTFESELTEHNIRKYLDEKSLELVYKQDILTEYDENQKLLTENTQIIDKPLLYQSALMDRIEGISSGYKVKPDVEGEEMRILLTNTGILTHLKLAYGEGKFAFMNNSIILEVAEPEKLVTDKTGAEYRQWAQDGNTFCYELIVPSHLKQDSYKFFQQDMERLFPYNVRVEKKLRPVWALQYSPGRVPLKSKGGPSSFEFTGQSGRLSNHSLAMFIANLNFKYLQHDERPIVNKTGIDYLVDLDFTADLTDVTEINKAIAPYGLELLKDLQPIEILIINDNPQTSIK
ncbi:hypothetical protein P872_12640 [Rhodonellum psychrophilum GCM71 = DSM 17998]|uniref:Thioredoxin domain-containing protein n=2 Tax=Rhodonellum TaxID=336827 RepID=U5BJK1_9BACT|nr:MULTISPECIES: redoxin domain-containing protein [Rhodonellum]ERM80615.1 hypothetical protein P872_12640 [Rhodonellum psychrophilum GCM71 = DSM 17998]SDZ55089.1 Thiol-disulfide isomerase or thioredoxin [Rhodonellum ikkaensis]